MDDIIGQITKVKLKANDVVVISSDPIVPSKIDEIIDAFPNNKVLFISNSTKISVINPNIPDLRTGSNG